MKSSKVMVVKGARLLAGLAAKTATISNSSSCGMWFYQPKVPSRLKEFCKK